VLLDEPTTGLDADATDRVTQQLRRLAASGTTIVAATHDFDVGLPGRPLRAAERRPSGVVGRPGRRAHRGQRGVGGYPDAWALIIQHAAVYRTSVPCTKGSKAGRTASMTWARVRSSLP